MNVTQYPAMLRKTPVWKLINLGQFEEVGVSQTMVASLPNGLVREARKGHFRGGTNPGVLTDQKKLTPLSFSVTDPAFVGVPLQWSGLSEQCTAQHIFKQDIAQSTFPLLHSFKHIVELCFAEKHIIEQHSKAKQHFVQQHSISRQHFFLVGVDNQEGL